MRFILYCFLFMLLAPKAFSQSEKIERTLSLKQMFDEIKSCKDSVYILKNALITLDTSRFDPRFGGFAYLDSLDIHVEVQLRGCQIQSLNLPIIMNVTFHKPVIFVRNTDWAMVFFRCTFKKMFRSSWCTGRNTMQFTECKVFGLVVINDNQFPLSFSRTDFTFTDTIPKVLNFEDGSKKPIFSITSLTRTEGIRFFSCSFKSLTDDIFIRISARTSALTLNRVDFGNMVLDLEDSEVFHHTEFIGCTINEPIGLESVLFSAPSTHIDWKQIENYKISLYDNYTEGPFSLGPVPEPSDSLIFAYDANFRNYKAIYASLLNIYRTRGDQPAYNACYIELKDIETRKYAFDYQQDKTLKRYFIWKLNVFLKLFCDYGTNPVGAILYAFYVILCFSVVYAFFPSENDALRKSSVIKKIDTYIHYFSTDKKIVELHREEKKKQLEEMNEMREKLESSREKVPFIFRMLLYPFYIVSVAYYRLSEWFVQRGGISEGIWLEQSKSAQFKSSMLISVYLLAYIIGGVMMRCVNAVTLSVNVFVTLGYGGVPAYGVAKYLAVLEGLIGWFLLSIFSVSLISQVLN